MERFCDTCDKFRDCDKAEELLVQDQPEECGEWEMFNIHRLLKEVITA